MKNKEKVLCKKPSVQCVRDFEQTHSDAVIAQ